MSCSKNCYLYLDQYVPLTAEFFGKEIGPVSFLRKLKVGMTAEEMVKAVPEYAGIAKESVNAGPDGVSIHAFLADKNTVTNFSMYMPVEGIALMEQSWGPASKEVDNIKRNHKVWRNPATGWRVSAEDEASPIGGNASITFDQYIPYATLLGTDKDSIGLLPKPVIGLTPEEVASAYPANIKGTGDSISLDFLPSEYGSYQTRVNFFINEGKVDTAYFSIDYHAAPNAKADIMALMKKKWGEPTVATDYEKSLIFHATAPIVTVIDDTISEAWKVKMVSKLD
jgi:hypothetical protein